MPFGLVTRSELEQHRRELQAEVKAAIAFEEEIKYEWALWFNKFRSLYATLLKREKKAAQDAPGGTIVDEPVPQDLPTLEEAKARWRAKRGLG